jgi:predicted dienelactone hydrolase
MTCPDPSSLRSGRIAPAALLAGALAAASCASEPTLLLAHDDARAGAPGDDGALGALLLQRSMRVRGDRVIDADVVAPTADDATVARGPFSPVLLVQGGAVALERYHWLAAHIASRGFVVVAPHHALDLAFFSQGDGLDALAALRRASNGDDGDLVDRVADAPALAIGHSLGGVVASNAFAGDEAGVTHLVLLSAVPNPGVDVSRTSGRVLSVAGSNDGLIAPAEVEDGARAFRATTTVAIVEGLTHFQLTDDPTDENLEREGTTSPLSVDEARARALFLVDAMLLDLERDPAGARLLDDPATWPQGVVVP